MDADVIIVGAGPAGLCLARSLSGRTLRVVVVEQQALAEIEDPQFDGREIALTQHSAKLMQELGLWELIAPDAIAPLRDARVMNGSDQFAMVIGHELSARSELGWLISNHLIRRAAYRSVQRANEKNGDIRILTGRTVTHLRTDDSGGFITLDDGSSLCARLVVAADSRFSSTRRMMGIAAHMHDFGRNMLVCAMSFEKNHDFAAWEWFDYGQTLALLPMNPDPQTGRHRASVVITQPSREVERMLQLPEAEFNAHVTQRYHNRLGPMQLASTRHGYPLVAVFPQRLIGQRFATVGDAAVGMHPVTAHGFNFGLLSVEGLTREISLAQRRGRDFAGADVLSRYESVQKRATLPLFWMTRLVVEIYTRESLPAKLARNVLLRLGDRLIPFKRTIAQSLAGL